MNAPLSKNQLDEYAARAEAASKGPWGSARDLQGVYTVQVNPRVIPGFGSVSEGDVAQILTREDDKAYANVRFIAMAREAVPALLAEVERLNAERHERNDALSKAIEDGRAKDQRIAELEKALVNSCGRTWRKAARLLEDTGRDDDAVNLLDNMADAHEVGGTAAVTA